MAILKVYGVLCRERTDYMSYDRNAELALADWLIAPCAQNRDSDVTDRCNWDIQLARLDGILDEEGSHEVHRFGHWACGWYELCFVKPGTKAAKLAQEMADALDEYPLLDEDEHSNYESKEADEVWKNCYNISDRIEYIRKFRNQFDFVSFADMLSCVRGNYFAGYPSELIY
jgi:hypothetical protein